MCFMKGLRTLTISILLGLVEAIFLNVRQNCRKQNLLYIISWTWNSILTAVQKQRASQNGFKKWIQEALLKLCDEFDYFYIHISILKKCINLKNHPHRTYTRFLRGSIKYPLMRRRTSAYQGVRTVAFSERIVYILYGWLLLAILGF